jgi:ribosome-associated protein
VNDITVDLPVRLGAFLKVAGVATTGGHAKVIVQEGHVSVNGAIETRRGRKLAEGDVVGLVGQEYRVCSSTT